MSVHSLAIPHIGSKNYGTITLSIGMSTQVATSEKALKQMVEEADQALYRSKHEGRNRVSIYFSKKNGNCA